MMGCDRAAYSMFSCFNVRSTLCCRLMLDFSPLQEVVKSAIMPNDHSTISVRTVTSVNLGDSPPCDTAATMSGVCSEALAVDDSGTRLVVLALGDPHLLERTQGREDGATNPH